MVFNFVDYKLLKTPKKASKNSIFRIVVVMVLLTFISCTTFFLIRALYPPEELFEVPSTPSSLELTITPENPEILKFLSQTYDEENNFYTIVLSLYTPLDLIDNERFKLKVSESLKSEIEDGFDRLFNGEKMVILNLKNYKVNDGNNSISIYYKLKFIKGKSDDIGDIGKGIYEGWMNYCVNFFDYIHKTRIGSEREEVKDVDSAMENQKTTAEWDSDEDDLRESVSIEGSDYFVGLDV